MFTSAPELIISASASTKPRAAAEHMRVGANASLMRRMSSLGVTPDTLPASSMDRYTDVTNGAEFSLNCVLCCRVSSPTMGRTKASFNSSPVKPRPSRQPSFTSAASTVMSPPGTTPTRFNAMPVS